MKTFINNVLVASSNPDVSPAELRVWLRRAAFRLRDLAPADGEDHVGLIDDARAIAGELPRNHDASRPLAILQR